MTTMKSTNPTNFDLIVVGAGIVGLAHAYTAAKRGLRVCVIERDAACVGASIRNFGFITVTGQGAGDTWRRAKRAREVWGEVAPQAGIAAVHHGLWLTAFRPKAMAVLEAFMATEMAEGCALLGLDEAASRAPGLQLAGAQGVEHLAEAVHGGDRHRAVEGVTNLFGDHHSYNSGAPPLEGLRHRVGSGVPHFVSDGENARPRFFGDRTGGAKGEGRGGRGHTCPGRDVGHRYCGTIATRFLPEHHWSR